MTADGATVIGFNSILEDPLSGWESGSNQWLCPAGDTGTQERYADLGESLRFAKAYLPSARVSRRS